MVFDPEERSEVMAGWLGLRQRTGVGRFEAGAEVGACANLHISDPVRTGRT
jgi:hypothetical protein